MRLSLKREYWKLGRKTKQNGMARRRGCGELALRRGTGRPWARVLPGGRSAVSSRARRRGWAGTGGGKRGTVDCGREEALGASLSPRLRRSLQRVLSLHRKSNARTYFLTTMFGDANHAP